MGTSFDKSHPKLNEQEDFIMAVQTVRIAVDALKAGYRFDDDKAKLKVQTLEHALEVLESSSREVARALPPKQA